MEYQRSDRVGDLILEVIAELLRKDIRDPRVQTATLTGVKGRLVDFFHAFSVSVTVCTRGSRMSLRKSSAITSRIKSPTRSEHSCIPCDVSVTKIS